MPPRKAVFCHSSASGRIGTASWGRGQMSAQVRCAASTMSPMITTCLSRSGAGPEELPQDMTATTADGVIVLTVEATLDAAGAVHPELPRICGKELTLDMVEDLLDPDPDELPEVKEYGGCLRKVSSFSVRSPEQGTPSRSLATTSRRRSQSDGSTREERRVVTSASSSSTNLRSNTRRRAGPSGSGSTTGSRTSMTIQPTAIQSSLVKPLTPAASSSQ